MDYSSHLCKQDVYYPGILTIACFPRDFVNIKELTRYILY